MVYMKTIREWPALKANDAVGLRKFSLFLSKCLNAMSCLSHLSELNHPPNMLTVIQKLPNHLQNKWRDQVSKARRYSNRILVYADLVEFVQLASDTANDPVYGRDSGSFTDQTTAGNKARKRPNGPGPKSGSFATGVKHCDKDSVHMCPLCKGTHDLDDCETFLSKSVDERRSFLQKSRLCFACYGSNHMSKGCTFKRTCKQCGKPHPTALHVNNFVWKSRSQLSSRPGTENTCKQSNDNTGFSSTPGMSHNNVSDKTQVEMSSVCTATKVENGVILHAVLPVQIYQQGCKNVITTYAFYDTGSSGCFITDDLCDRLGAHSVNTQLQLRTMHGSSCTDSRVVSNLVVTDMQGQNAIPLPKSYTRCEIPIAKTQIPRPEIVRKWDHLRNVADQLPAYRDDIQVEILIGSNCPAALEPLAVVPASGQGLFATRLRHGWTLYSPLKGCTSRPEEVTCNRVCFQETERYREVMGPTAVQKLLELDFQDCKTETYTEERDLSREDGKFLEIAEDGTTDTTTSESRIACTDVYATQRDEGTDMTSCMLNYFSDWYKLKRVAAVSLKVKKILKDRVARRKETCPVGSDYQLTSNDIREAETAISSGCMARSFRRK